MNYPLFFVLFFCVFFQSAHASETLEIHHYLDESIPFTWAAYSKENEKMVNTQKGYLNPKDVLSFSNYVWNVLSLVLPTSPCCVYFNIEECDQPHLKMNNNKVYFGDTISIQQDKKWVFIHNLTTEKRVACLPKGDSFFRMGEKQWGQQLNKHFSIWNINIPFVIISKIAHQKPIMDQKGADIKKSKFFRSVSEYLSNERALSVDMYSSEKNQEIIDSMITLEICGALQKIKIRPSCDAIQNGDTVCIEQMDDGYIVLFKMVNQIEHILAKICTADVRISIP